MKKVLVIVLPLLIGFVFLSFSIKEKNSDQTINPLLGDLSFINKFGHLPDETTNEDIRIKTHLEYVEGLLRKKDCSDLSVQHQNNREKVIDLLHGYWTAGVFPRNYDYSEKRIPCFIDKEGRICAVGYLIEQTVGRQTAEEINKENKYAEIMNMDEIIVEHWIKESGLTKEECAMIQPSYGYDPLPNYNYISPAYGVGSAILSGINAGLTTINLIQGIKGADNKCIGYISLATGAASIVYGVVMLPVEEHVSIASTSYYQTNESQKILSFFNIGLGTTTMVMGAFNLLSNCDKKEKTVYWNLNQVPITADHSAFQLSFSKTF